MCYQLSFESKSIRFCGSSRFSEAAEAAANDRIVIFVWRIAPDSAERALPGKGEFLLKHLRIFFGLFCNYLRLILQILNLSRILQTLRLRAKQNHCLHAGEFGWIHSDCLEAAQSLMQDSDVLNNLQAD